MFERIEIITENELFSYRYENEEVANNSGMWIDIKNIPIIGTADETALTNGYSLSDRGWIKYL